MRKPCSTKRSLLLATCMLGFGSAAMAASHDVPRCAECNHGWLDPALNQTGGDYGASHYLTKREEFRKAYFDGKITASTAAAGIRALDNSRQEFWTAHRVGKVPTAEPTVRRAVRKKKESADDVLRSWGSSTSSSSSSSTSAAPAPARTGPAAPGAGPGNMMEPGQNMPMNQPNPGTNRFQRPGRGGPQPGRPMQNMPMQNMPNMPMPPMPDNGEAPLPPQAQ